METISLPFKDPNPYKPTPSQQVFLFIFCLLLCASAFNINTPLFFKTNRIVIFTSGISVKDYVRILTEIRVDQWGQILATMMGAGFREEIIYRFILFKVLFLETLRLPFWIALTLSSVLFGITHYNNLMRLGDPMSVIITSYQVCGATIMGFLLGYLYYYTNNLMFVILLHGIYDFINSVNNTVLYKHIMEEEEKKK